MFIFDRELLSRDPQLKVRKSRKQVFWLQKTKAIFCLLLPYGSKMRQIIGIKALYEIKQPLINLIMRLYFFYFFVTHFRDKSRIRQMFSGFFKNWRHEDMLLRFTDLYIQQFLEIKQAEIWSKNFYAHKLWQWSSRSWIKNKREFII